MIKDLFGIKSSDDQAREDYYRDRGEAERNRGALFRQQEAELRRKAEGRYTEEEATERLKKDAERELLLTQAEKQRAENSKLNYENLEKTRQALAEKQMADKLKVDAEASKILADTEDQKLRTENMRKDRARLEDAIYMTSELAKGKAEEAGRNAALKAAFEMDKGNPELMAEVAASNARLNLIGETARHQENIAMISMGNPQQYQSAVSQYFAAQYGYKDNEGSKQANDQQFKQKYFEVETTTGGGTTGEPQNKIKAFLPIDKLQNFSGGMPNGAMGAQAQADTVDYLKSAFPSGGAYSFGRPASNPIQDANYIASGGSTMFTPEPAQAPAQKRWVFDPTTGGMKLQNP